MSDSRMTELVDMLYAYLIDYQNILKAAINKEINKKERIARQIAITGGHAERIDKAIAAWSTCHVEMCRNQWQWKSGFCCSECFYTVPFVGKFTNKPFTYCPNCGMKVKKEGGDD